MITNIKKKRIKFKKGTKNNIICVENKSNQNKI